MKTASISEMLNSLIELYDFNKNTLSKYLGISIEQIETIAQGNVDCLPKEPTYCNRLLTKVGFLYFSVIENKDLKLSAFLEVLISYHNLSKKSIAEMAGVKISVIDEILSNSTKNIDIEAKYKIAITVMTLRFFLKDCEPSI